MPVDNEFVKSLEILNSLAKKHGFEYSVEESKAPVVSNCYGWWIMIDHPFHYGFHYGNISDLTEDVISGNFEKEFMNMEL